MSQQRIPTRGLLRLPERTRLVLAGLIAAMTLMIALTTIASMQSNAAPLPAAEVDLKHPVGPTELVALEPALGVRVTQFHERHAGPFSTITSGGIVLPADTLAQAIDRHEREIAKYYDLRVAAMEASANVGPADQREMWLRTAADLRSARESLTTRGIRIDRLIVRGSADSIARLREHPAVAEVR